MGGIGTPAFRCSARLGSLGPRGHPRTRLRDERVVGCRPSNGRGWQDRRVAPLNLMHEGQCACAALHRSHTASGKCLHDFDELNLDGVADAARRAVSPCMVTKRLPAPAGDGRRGRPVRHPRPSGFHRPRFSTEGTERRARHDHRWSALRWRAHLRIFDDHEISSFTDETRTTARHDAPEASNPTDRRERHGLIV